jgi:hypothetical protein
MCTLFMTLVHYMADLSLAGKFKNNALFHTFELQVDSFLHNMLPILCANKNYGREFPSVTTRPSEK